MPFDRKGPLPLPNRFLCYTRPSRSFRSASHPPSVTNLASEKSFLFHLYPISGQLLLKKVLLETFAFTLPPTGAVVKPIFSSYWTSSPNSSHKTLLWFYLKFAVSSCDSDFFHEIQYHQQQDHMRFPFRYCLNFENTDLIFFAVFRKIN